MLGITHLRGHETNRLEALATEINRLGSKGHRNRRRPAHRARTAARWPLALVRRSPHGHRRALIGLVTDDVDVDDIETTAKPSPTSPPCGHQMIAGAA